MNPEQNGKNKDKIFPKPVKPMGEDEIIKIIQEISGKECLGKECFVGLHRQIAKALAGKIAKPITAEWLEKVLMDIKECGEVLKELLEERMGNRGYMPPYIRKKYTPALSFAITILERLDKHKIIDIVVENIKRDLHSQISTLGFSYLPLISVDILVTTILAELTKREPKPE